MQIDANEQPTPRSAEWLAGWASATTTARSQVDTLRAEVERCRIEKWCEETQVPRLAAELATTRDLLADVWQQFAVPGKDGKLWAGGLSTLEAVDRVLHGKDDANA